MICGCLLNYRFLNSRWQFPCRHCQESISNVSFPAARQGDLTGHGGTVRNGSTNVFINGKPAVFAGGSTTSCPIHCSAQAVIQGASTVFINDIPIAFVGSSTSCGALIVTGSPDVFIGDGQLKKTGSQPLPVLPASAGIAMRSHVRQGEYDDCFVLRHAGGQTLAHVAYAMQRQSGIFEYGETDADGHTHLLSSVASAENIRIYLAG
ncbi:hypothetical protein G3N58_29160 [Paraburkholderia sp. Ac-20342]|nr:hypothetical protein [Paraburkholderia sp. Ac-20342]